MSNGKSTDAEATLDDLLEGMTKTQFMLRFTITNPDLDTTIVGTASLDHLSDNLKTMEAGPLSADVYDEAKRRLSGVA